ncbi:MAG: hypothetical protein ACKVXR_02435 [Planctomycetota bacterium]
MSLRKTLAPLLLALCAACASFRGEELPQRDLGELAESERLPAVTYVLSNAQPPSGNFPSSGTEHCVDRVFRSAFTEAEAKESDAGLHLEIHYSSRARQPVFTLGLGLLALASLGVIPAYGRNDLTLSVRAEVDGVLVQRYEYEDHVVTWIHLFVIPWAFSHDPVEVEGQVLENMLLNFLHDLRRDLPGFPSPAAG